MFAEKLEARMPKGDAQHVSCYITREELSALLAVVKAAQKVEQTFRGNESPPFTGLRQALRGLEGK